MFLNEIRNKWTERMTFIMTNMIIASIGVFALSPAIAVSAIETRNKALFFQALEGSVNQSHEAKFAALSQTLLGAEYIGGSVGEGDKGQYDRDPLIRFDVFDCTTYVETVLAGVLASSKADFKEKLVQLRYKEGDVSFVSRNHFPSLDWFHNNQAILRDISPEVGNGRTRVAKTVIDKKAWYEHLNGDVLHCDEVSSPACRQRLAQLHEEGKAFKPEFAYVPYVPLTALFIGKDKAVNQALLDRIPSGSVISMVRPDWALKKYIGTNMNVSHQGFAIRKNGVLFLRHASQTYHKVMDQNFAEYFAQYPESSSLKGFNVQVLRRF